MSQKALRRLSQLSIFLIEKRFNIAKERRTGDTNRLVQPDYTFCINTLTTINMPCIARVKGENRRIGAKNVGKTCKEHQPIATTKLFPISNTLKPP